MVMINPLPEVLIVAMMSLRRFLHISQNESITPFHKTFRRRVKSRFKKSLHQNPKINETDLYNDDDPLYKRIPGIKSLG